MPEVKSSNKKRSEGCFKAFSEQFASNISGSLKTYIDEKKKVLKRIESNDITLDELRIIDSASINDYNNDSILTKH